MAPDSDMVSHTSAASGEHPDDVINGTGALVVGRRVFDHTHGWSGSHPLGVPVFVVTHSPPAAWPYPEAPILS
jgi:hypothetical protein